MTSQASKKINLRAGQSALQSSRTLRVLDGDVDVTPKPLVHEHYPVVRDRQQIALDPANLRLRSGSVQMIFPSPGYRMSSALVRSPSIYTTVLDDPLNSLKYINGDDPMSRDGSDRAPSPFYSPSVDSRLGETRPDKMTITLKETDTIILFELPQLTVDLDTPEGQAVKAENERYDSLILGLGPPRRLTDDETQTTRIYTKSRATYLGWQQRQNQGTFVNNWVISDTYNTPGKLQEHNGLLIEGPAAPTEVSQPRYKLPNVCLDVSDVTMEQQLHNLYGTELFRAAAETMERIVASQTFITAQKRFKGLIKPDPCSLDLKFDYRLDLLWTHSHLRVTGRRVSSICWNYSNTDVLAAGYEAGSSSPRGMVLIWSMKNPLQPDRIYEFDSPVADVDWSRVRPNQLAVGFFDGTLRVIDVSSRALVVLRSSSRETSPTFSPQWQVQWWQDSGEETLWTCNQDGAVFQYDLDIDFTAREVMRIPWLEGKIPGVARVSHCNLYNIPIQKNPGALLLRRHPVTESIYMIGSEEGCVYRCSTNHLHQHTDSFLAHDGPIYALEYSPFCEKLFLTCGADWCARIWVDGIAEPLLTLSTRMACVQAAVWSPVNATIIASCVGNEICLWDIKRRTYKPISITSSAGKDPFVLLQFTSSGNQLVAADSAGVIYIYSLEGIPFPPFDQTLALTDAVRKSLVTKPELLNKLTKIGPPF